MAHEATGTFTDLYEFTMAQAYLEHGMTGEAVFDLHVRDLPPSRGYLVAAGLDTLLDRLEAFRFTEADLAFLGEQGLSDDLLGYLADLRFEGRIEAVPEGRLVFPFEPLLQVHAPLPVGQLIETLVLNTIHVETVLATKAARCVDAVGGFEGDAPALVDFGARRAHGMDAARAAARSAYLAGFQGTSLVSLARELEIPCFGTMAHSFVQAFPDERAALRAFTESFPQGTTVLIDTYDALEGARRAAELAATLAARGHALGGVRIDSGDLEDLSRQVRGILDADGHEEVEILASGGLDEHALAGLVNQGAPIDGYGVGTSLVVSEDAPSINIAYKLCQYEGEPVMKTSAAKHTLPGVKQVHRTTDARGSLAGDTIARQGEEVEGEPLLAPPPHERGSAGLEAARARLAEELPRLPAQHRRLRDPALYPVARSQGLKEAVQTALARVGREAPSG
ncbi:MAG: nicotinate phosphoribosyltransferase [Candidatus Thermoplasmatota archaeon]|nr:nicotinate phosphoribosyltransferase [Candidatus Thermoplasmatota archaeon]